MQRGLRYAGSAVWILTAGVCFGAAYMWWIQPMPPEVHGIYSGMLGTLATIEALLGIVLLPRKRVGVLMSACRTAARAALIAVAALGGVAAMILFSMVVQLSFVGAWFYFGMVGIVHVVLFVVGIAAVGSILVESLAVIGGNVVIGGGRITTR